MRLEALAMTLEDRDQAANGRECALEGKGGSEGLSGHDSKQVLGHWMAPEGQLMHTHQQPMQELDSLSLMTPLTPVIIVHATTLRWQRYSGVVDTLCNVQLQ